jgi:cell wall-associated NlpC family hydrolase
VQVALDACGIACPRDSDMQEAALGKSISLAGLQRGDLIFWKGHVAIALGRNSMIHANAFHMAVATEPVAVALARIGATGSQVTGVRRIGRAK